MAGGRLDVPLLGVLDEAANVCRWSQLPNLYSHFGSRGIVLMTILQSWSQGVQVWRREGMGARDNSQIPPSPGRWSMLVSRAYARAARSRAESSHSRMSETPAGSSARPRSRSSCTITGVHSASSAGSSAARQANAGPSSAAAAARASRARPSRSSTTSGSSRCSSERELREPSGTRSLSAVCAALARTASDEFTSGLSLGVIPGP
ncbi:TraM recognition domain-containing protein [Cellulomonas sp. JH27-2]|uniref:TraM recognition domain-containing protein n=1 Tax=Cellulomonas sp. JH27-2 TaxID=2774139 RepID=UPI001CD8DC51|nr:TraM recognition domain-containing protein [Cellulomonas sp. JH27-2]